MKSLTSLLGVLTSALVLSETPVLSQNVSILPENERSIALGWEASKTPSVTGYKVYLSKEPGVYTNPLTFDVKNNLSTVIEGLESDKVYHLTTTAYGAGGVESEFAREIRVNMGPKPTANLTNVNGKFYYQITETRHTKDNLFSLMQSETTNNWRNVTSAQKISETDIDRDTYITTWRVPASQPLAKQMYFKSKYLVNAEKNSSSKK